jgi:hypothetical protein
MADYTGSFIDQSGIFPGAEIKSQHVLRIINPLSYGSDSKIAFSGSVSFGTGSVRSGEKVLVMLNTSDKNNGLKPFVIVSGSLSLSPVFVTDTGGNVGVGTSTVQAKFNVYGDSSLVNALVKVNSNIATNALFISSRGKVGINTDIIGDYNLCVSGSFSATTKSFLIDHQKQQGKKLQYGVLEGPEHAVFYRGKLKHKHNIELPEDWEWLVDQDTITVHLTAVHPTKTPSILRIENNTVHLAGAEKDIDCHFIIHAERKDVPKIKTVI